MILRSRVTRSSPPPILRQRRTLGRESLGAELTTEEAGITESPTAFHHAASSDDDDRFTRFRRRRDYDEQGDSRPAREEIIIERRDEDEPRARARYVDPEEDGYRVRPMSPIVEDIDAFDDFHFIFPAEDPSKDAELSDLDTPTTESESTQKVERPLSNAITAPGIYSSSYSGTAELGAQHDVNLTLLHDPRGQKQPLFRWL